MPGDEITVTLMRRLTAKDRSFYGWVMGEEKPKP